MNLIKLTLSLTIITLSLFGGARAQNPGVPIDIAKTAVGLSVFPSAAPSTLTARPTRNANAAPDEAESKAAARRVLDLLVAQNFAEIRRMFNEEMRQGLSEEKMREVWTSVIQNVGSFKRLTDSEFARMEGYEVVGMRCEFERGFIVVRVAYDGQKKIGGLYVLPSS